MVLFAELFVYALGLELQELSTICVVIMAVNCLTVIYYAARPLDLKRTILLVSMSAAMLTAVVFFGDVFSLSLSGLSFAGWLVLAAMALLVVPVQMLLERLFDKCSEVLARRAERKNHIGRKCDGEWKNRDQPMPPSMAPATRAMKHMAMKRYPRYSNHLPTGFLAPRLTSSRASLRGRTRKNMMAARPAPRGQM